MCNRRVYVGPTCRVVSEEPTSSGSLWGTMRTVSAVGPAVVEGSRGGCTSTSTTSCEPPNRVTDPGRIVVHPAARPTGANENDSVVSPRLTIVSWKTAEVPGTTSMSLRENHAWAAIAATLLGGAPPWASIPTHSVTHPGQAIRAPDPTARTGSAEADAVPAGQLCLAKGVVRRGQQPVRVHRSATHRDADRRA